MVSQGEAVGAGAAVRVLNPLLDPDVETASRALSLMMLEVGTEAYLSVESEGPLTSTDEPFPYLIPKTRIFINTAVARDLRADALTAFAVWAASGSASLSTGAALLRKIQATAKLLDDTSLDLFVVVTTASSRKGGRPATWVDVVAAYDGNTSGLKDSLGKLVRRNVLVRHPDGWTVNP